MSALVLEIHQPGPAPTWRPVGRLRRGDVPGSLSHNPQGEGGREVIMFACHGPYSTIERSVEGVDAELAGGLARGISSAGFEEVARLEDGQKMDMWLRTDRHKRPVRLRFRHEADDG